MKKILSLTACLSLLLVACGKPGKTDSPRLEALMNNPLFVERYAEEMVQAMVEYTIREDPLLEDEERKDYIESQRSKWLKIAQQARRDQRKGTSGFFVPMQEYTKGEVLLYGKHLHFSSVTDMVPHPSLQIYLTTIVDPRDQDFPDASAVHVGALQTPYGAQSYEMEQEYDPENYRTVVIWDDKVKKIYTFAQLIKR